MEVNTARARLAELDRELERLRKQHDLAMSAFRFEDTLPVHERIVAIEAKRRALLERAPSAATAPPPPESTIIPGPASPARAPAARSADDTSPEVRSLGEQWPAARTLRPPIVSSNGRS
jgi:hypothetical protein